MINLDLVCNLNSEGVRHLTNKNFVGAAVSFHSALKLLDDDLAMPANTTIRSDDSSAILTTVSMDELVSEYHSFVCPKALTFQKTSPQWTDNDAVFVAGLVKYNAALLLHLQEQGDGGKSRRAALLYRQALRDLRTIAQNRGGDMSNGTVSATVAAIVCINNLAEIYADFNQIKRAKSLMSMAMSLVNCLRETQNADVLDDEFAVFFFDSVTLLNFQDDSGQAAASA